MDAALIPLLLTLKVALLATAAAVVLGVVMAYLVSRPSTPGRNVLDAVLTLPMVLPPTVLGYYLLVVIGRRGVLGSWLNAMGINLIFTWQAAVLAARTLGSGELEVFLRVSLPLAMRGIAAGGMLAFARAMGEFGATLMVAGNIPGKTQTLSLAVYSAVQAGDDGLALMLAGVISMACAIILATANHLLGYRY